MSYYFNILNFFNPFNYMQRMGCCMTMPSLFSPTATPLPYIDSTCMNGSIFNSYYNQFKPTFNCYPSSMDTGYFDITHQPTGISYQPSMTGFNQMQNSFQAGFNQYNLTTPTWGIQTYSSTTTKKAKDTKKTKRSSGSQSVATGYAAMSTKEAYKAAQNDDNLEFLKPKKGARWNVSTNSFKNDIPFAREGTSAILDDVSSKVSRPLVITSALGTKTSPHSGKNNGTGHYDPKNPKLDIGGGLNKNQSKALADELMKTGYFEFVTPEPNDENHPEKGWHLDLKIKDETYVKFGYA